MINRDMLDEIQNPAGSILTRIRQPIQPNQQDQWKTPDKDVSDAQLLARIVDLPGSCVAANPAAVWTFMKFEPVPAGRCWEITRVGVFASDPSTILSGVSVVAYKGMYVPQDGANAPNTLEPMAFNGQVPNTQYPGRFGHILLPGYRVVIGCKGLANGQTLTGSVGVIDRDLYNFLKHLAVG